MALVCLTSLENVPSTSPLLSLSIQDWFPFLVLHRSLQFDKPPCYFSYYRIEVSYICFCLGCFLGVICKRLHVALLIIPNILLDGSMCIIVIFLCLSFCALALEKGGCRGALCLPNFWKQNGGRIRAKCLTNSGKIRAKIWAKFRAKSRRTKIKKRQKKNSGKLTQRERETTFK